MRIASTTSVKVVLKRAQLAELVEKSLNSLTERVFVGIGYRVNEVYFVEELHECPNVAETPSTRFKADPLCLYEVHKRAESLGREIVLLAHSHPATPVPSSEDLEGMKLWPLPWLIVSSLTGECKAWILVGNSLREVSIEGLA